MNHVTGFHVDYDDARKEYEVHVAYLDCDNPYKVRKEFQFRCNHKIFEQLAKDAIDKYQEKVGLLGDCPACGHGDISISYRYNSEDTIRPGSKQEVTEEYMDGYLVGICQRCDFCWRIEPLWKQVSNEN
ncbi:hypothetical protein LCGC14_1318940 [marine sediment metagenome]|uniref:Uncharacterized protein n=1 Tax=marine sediment metagenome TaxID=412755 RepID=A0A0F9KK31_9ZZZZ